MDLDGRRVADVIGDCWIINDGGETTIVVNDVKLHDGADGVVLDGNGEPIKAPNGAFDVWMRTDGLTVDINTSPWTISDRSDSTIADRDFSAEDFEGGVSPPPPPPELEQPEQPLFKEEYAPRAAVYEALPGFLLGLTGARPGSERLRQQSG